MLLLITLSLFASAGILRAVRTRRLNRSL
jgi:hypothetical protein